MLKKAQMWQNELNIFLIRRKVLNRDKFSKASLIVQKWCICQWLRKSE